MHSDTHTRSLMKTATYRMLIITTNAVIVFFVTGRYDITFWVLLSTNIFNTLLYFFHERLWNRIGWGTKIPSK